MRFLETNGWMHFSLVFFDALKKLPLLFCLCGTLLMVFPQDSNVETRINELKLKLAAAHEKSDQLVLLDSLAKLVRDQAGYPYDSLARRVIALAFELDSEKIGTEQTSNLIAYLNSTAQRAWEGMAVFQHFQERDIVLDDPLLAAQLYANGADSHYFSGELAAAIPIYAAAEAFALKGQDSMLYALIRTYKAAAYSDIGKFAEASQALSESARFFQRARDTTSLLRARNSLSILYSQNGFFEEAKKERDEIMAVVRARQDNNALIPLLYNAARDFDKMDKQAERIAALGEAYAYALGPEYDQPLGPVLAYGLLKAYVQNDSVVQAERMYQKIRTDFAQDTPVPYEWLYHEALANYHLAKGNYTKALGNAKWVLEYGTRSGEFELVYDANKLLAELYEALGNTSLSYTHYRAYMRHKDSIGSVQKIKALSYYQTLYETEKQDFKIKAQHTEIALLDTKNKLKTQWILFGGLGLLASFTIVILLYAQRFNRKKRKLQTQFAQHLIKNREDQYTHVSRELHDSVGQKLMLLTKKMRGNGNSDTTSLAESALEELRTISRGLYPADLESLGATKAIAAMINEVDAHTDILFTHELDDIDRVLDKESALHLYRIVQEVLNNLVKHSGAKAASVRITHRGNTVEMVINDNGKGFDFEEKIKQSTSLGMRTLLERAKIIHSRFHVESVPSKGTTIALTIAVQK
ncbi:ATP-binding protein [Flavobacteriaceae bacterium 3-367]